MARSMGLSSKDEWDEYACPGAYRLPKDADVVWASEFKSWPDWLGLMLPFAEARALVRPFGLNGQVGHRSNSALYPTLVFIVSSMGKSTQ